MAFIEHPIQQQQNTFFPSSHGKFIQIDHILGYKTSLDKYKRIQVIQSTFSDHNGIKGEMRKYFDLNECENTAYQNLWDKPKIVLKEEIYSTNYI